MSIAKNYLSGKELKNLNEIVEMYLDYANRQAKKRIVMYMNDWVEKLDAFLQFNEEDILQDIGKVTHEIAKSFAESEFEKYRVIQDREYRSDFDLLLENDLFNINKNGANQMDKKNGEVLENATVRKFRTVQIEVNK